jgi:hypothetical protein
LVRRRSARAIAGVYASRFSHSKTHYSGSGKTYRQSWSRENQPIARPIAAHPRPKSARHAAMTDLPH